MVRLAPFIYNTTIAYEIELGNLYARFLYNGSVITSIITPYLEEHLFELHIEQIGDVMWLVHPNYAPRKITRTTATVFSIDVIPFTNGPFLLRNDLIDSTITNSSSMKYTGSVEKGSFGTLLSCASSTTIYTITQMNTNDTITIVGQGDLSLVFPVGYNFVVVGNSYSPNNNTWKVSSTSYVSSTTTFTITTATHIFGTYNGGTITVASVGNSINFFNPLHIGALFKLTTVRNKTVSIPNTLAAVGVICEAIDVKGTYTFTTTAFTTSITGKIILERSENGSDWETIRSDTSNIQYSGVENEDNVQYRAKAIEIAGGSVSANITVVDPTMSGIVKVTGYTSPSLATVQVLSKLDSGYGTMPTKRWAEGAWSNYRTWPTSITFLNDRCIYGGMQSIPVQVIY